MPQTPVFNFQETPREKTPLEQTLTSFAERQRYNQIQKQETDALKEIYSQYQQDGRNIENAFIAAQSNPDLGPSARVAAVDNLLKYQKHNAELQEQAKKQLKEEQTAARNKQINRDQEKAFGLPEGALAGYEDKPALAAQMYKPPKKTQASQPIEEDQLRRIQHVESQPEFQAASLPQKSKMFRDAGVSKENNDSVMKSYGDEADLNIKSFDTAYNANKKFIDDTTSKYSAFETEMKPKLLQMRNIPDEDLISPTAAVFLDAVGLPLGSLADPSSELYQKLSQDLLKGLPETYGNRILKVEVDNFLKTIPTLMNSADGRRMITSNMLKLGEMKEVYYKAMRRMQEKALEDGKFPRDFQQKVFDQVKPQIDKINQEFVKLSEIKHVPPGTIPFFNPNGDIEFVPEEHAQWATENEGKRIW